MTDEINFDSMSFEECSHYIMELNPDILQYWENDGNVIAKYLAKRVRDTVKVAA
ncbi:hypothetical protein HNV12_20870 [Methanococcoides sp. SA1]|nr:hypothetical protein [Methanococcoides sp. SA1]